MSADSRWPSATTQSRTWKQASRAGTRADRTLTEIAVTIPAPIASVELTLTAQEATSLDAATAATARLDSLAGHTLQALGVLLLRSESVASSKIERIDAGIDDYARALYGSRRNSAATSMVAATEAMADFMSEVTQSGAVELPAILKAHQTLMAEDPHEAASAGQLREVQNWVGGSDYSPHGALLIPPPPELLANAMDDLIAFCKRRDLPALAQAAIAHAQFETIHPFNDGNGRIGRALINAILRTRGTLTTAVVPLATALVAQRDRYFDLLNDYRAGNIDDLIATFATATSIAAEESLVTAAYLADVPKQWAELTGPPRRRSAVGQLLPHLVAQPILTAESASRLIDSSPTAIYAAMDRLHEAGVLRPLTDRKRNQVWGAGLVLDELDDLAARVAAVVV